MVDTDRPAACTAAKVRAAMPGTPIIPLPATVTSAWPRMVASALTGYRASPRRAVTDVPGCSGSRNDRTRSVVRVPSSGMSARGCSTLAPKYAASAASRRCRSGMTRAPGTSRGSAVRMPVTSFQSTTSAADSERARSVAVRSVPPRPSVATDPSGAAPKNPGTTGVTPRASSGPSTRRAARRVWSRSGDALPCRPSVTTISMGSTRRARGTTAASSALESRSPRLTSRSDARADSSPSAATARQTSRYSRADASSAASSRRRAGAGSRQASMTARCRRSSAAATCAPASASPSADRRAPSSSRSVTPASADATSTRRPWCPATSAAARRRPAASASEAPPNFQTDACDGLTGRGWPVRRSPGARGSSLR